MTKLLTITLLSLVVGLGACAGPSQKLDANTYALYAEGVHEGPTLTLSEVVENSERYEGQTVRIEADVVKVCPKKGCWVTITEGDMEPLFAKFKQCDSYLPLDLTGRIIVEGVVKNEVVSVDEQIHLLEDEGMTHEEAAAKVKGPQTKLRFTASGAATKI